jgi:diacylglycerol O-acyltransferase-1
MKRVEFPIDDSSNRLSGEDDPKADFSSSSLATKTAELEMQRRVDSLQEELRVAKESLERLKKAIPATMEVAASAARDDAESSPTTKRESEERQPPWLVPPAKRGYLFRWVDRSIGWTGTKWALRFVSLENGKIAYYGCHTDASPRYVLSLRGCAVRDEGWKPNRRHPAFRKKESPSPPLDEAGAYFFVFSIYLREDASPAHQDPTLVEPAEVVPLLRFSTNSLAERSQWIKLISETCAYCETDDFLAEMDRQQQEQFTMAMIMPEAKTGTLPPLYFAPARPKSRRRPSFSKLPNAAMFRTKSENVDAEKVDARSTKGYPPSKPMHRLAAPSYLSVEAPVQNYRGFLNLGVIILLLSNFRLILGHIHTHGFVVLQLWEHMRDLPHISEHPWENFPFLSGFLLLFLMVVLTFAIEWLLSRKRLNETVGMTLHYLNAHSSGVIPIWIVWNFVDKPAVGAVLLLQGTTTWMKLLSYLHANEDYRCSMRCKDIDSHRATLALIENLDHEDLDITYPKNVTLGNIFYFWIAPTLTYQIAFPKYPRVRLWKVAAILIRMVPILALFTFFVAQVVTPALASLVHDLEKTKGAYTAGMLAQYWLRLSIANTYLWLLMFYFYFHLWLNLLAELSRWGDRVFYKDWWNSAEVSAYWRLWNMPVHYWLVRHLYFPCIRLKMSKTAATFVVFLFSAVMHEVLVSVPFHMVRPWSFIGMMMQIPLVGLTKYLNKRFPDGFIGNVVFWVSFCVVGQPMAVLLYTADYQYAKHMAQEGCAAILPEPSPLTRLKHELLPWSTPFGAF